MNDVQDRVMTWRARDIEERIGQKIDEIARLLRERGAFGTCRDVPYDGLVTEEMLDDIDQAVTRWMDAVKQREAEGHEW